MTTYLLSVLVLAAPPVNIETIDGDALTGALVELSVDQVKVATQEGEQTLPVSSILRIKPTSPDTFEKPGAAAFIELIDGTFLYAAGYTVKDRVASVVLTTGQTTPIQTRNIKSVRFETSDRLTPRWNEIIASDTTGDVIVIKREREGEVSLDYIDDGVFGDISAESVGFTFDDELHDVTRENKVAGLFYYHAAGRELPETVCRISDVAGNQWQTKTCEVVDDKVEFTTVAGAKVELPIGAVEDFDYSAGKLQYLANLKPDSVQFTPYLGSNVLEGDLAQYYHPRMNKDFQGNDKPHNIAIRSRTRMVFTLPGKFGVFQATAGIDAQTSPSGSVKLVISGDGDTLFSKEIKASDESEKIEFAIEGVERLSIFVDYGDNFQTQDHLNISNSMVKK